MNGNSRAVAPVRRGHLVLLVGPSGAGKDSILDGARIELADDAKFQFVQREITRPADAGGENHLPVTWDAFCARSSDGSYALAWKAHGHGYGVPATALHGLVCGQSAIVNVSRGVIASARAHFAPTRVIHVSVPKRILAQRLIERGREGAEEIERRLERAAPFHVDGADVLTLVNDGPLAGSVASFVAMLRALPANG
jgi:phosphonate metabolism protein PhnN/1,5-bisphosphokinase (PRPP-forming)